MVNYVPLPPAPVEVITVGSAALPIASLTKSKEIRPLDVSLDRLAVHFESLCPRCRPRPTGRLDNGGRATSYRGMSRFKTIPSSYPAGAPLEVKGSRAWMVVPRFSCESIESSPPTNFKRSCMLVRPSPVPFIAASASKPAPRSLTVR
jgi:hypothetical protein